MRGRRRGRRRHPHRRRSRVLRRCRSQGVRVGGDERRARGSPTWAAATTTVASRRAVRCRRARSCSSARSTVSRSRAGSSSRSRATSSSRPTAPGSPIRTRVGVMPGWGLTVLLPQRIGVARAREMSVTGNFIDAQQAYEWGLVNHVVPHDELLPFCRKLAADSITIDQRAVRRMLATYAEVTDTTIAQGWEVEDRVSASGRGRASTPPRSRPVASASSSGAARRSARGSTATQSADQRFSPLPTRRAGRWRCRANGILDSGVRIDVRERRRLMRAAEHAATITPTPGTNPGDAGLPFFCFF